MWNLYWSILCQDRVTNFIEWMERELRELRGLLDDIADCSDQKGFLQVGNTIKIVKKATPNAPPVVSRARVRSLEYKIHNLEVEKIQDGVSAEDSFPMVTIYDPKDHTVRKVDPGGDGDDESEEGSGVFYPSDEVNDDMDDGLRILVIVM